MAEHPLGDKLVLQKGGAPGGARPLRNHYRTSGSFRDPGLIIVSLRMRGMRLKEKKDPYSTMCSYPKPLAREFNVTISYFLHLGMKIRWMVVGFGEIPG